MAESAPAEFQAPTAAIPIGDLIPFCGCVCFITSIYTDFPDCIGCAGKRVCLCCYSDFLACKLPKEGETVWFHWSKGYTYCAPVKVICLVRCDNNYYYYICFKINLS